MDIQELVHTLNTLVENGTHENTEIRTVWDDDMDGEGIISVSLMIDSQGVAFVGIYSI